MTCRAQTYPQPIAFGTRAGGDPIDEREHFLKCPTCGYMIDMRNLGEVLEHDDDDHLPPLES